VACPRNLAGLRDRALVLLGFSTGLRRSHLAGLVEVRDLTFTDRGLHILIRRSKTDPLGTDPRTVAVPFGAHPGTCPVRAVRAWLKAAGIGENGGPLFRAVDRHGNVSARPLCPRSVAKILAKAVLRAGIHTAKVRVSPHSLRVGMATQAAINGAEERDIQRTTLHRSAAMVRRYVRDADPFRAAASGRLGL
jgi:integrase